MNLLETAKEYLLNEDVLSKLSALIGESPEKTKAATLSAIPTLIAGLIQKVSTSQGSTAIFDLIRHGGHDGSILNNISSVFSGNTSNLLSSGTGLTEAVFGAKSTAMSSLIAGLVGINQGSASKLLGLVSPVVMGLIGKHIKTANITDATGLKDFLVGQKDNIKAALPSGLGSLLGFASIDQLGAGSMGNNPDGLKKIVPLIAAGIAAIGLLYLLKNKNMNQMTETAEQTATQTTNQVQNAVDSTTSAIGQAAKDATQAAADAVTKVGSFFKRTLSTGVELNIPENGVETKLISFIEDRNRQIDKTTWFTMDRITFETGSAKLKAESAEQLSNIVEILKAYPEVELKIGGYTDNTGNADANLTLSSARADSIKDALIERGIPESRLKSEGYGQEHPVADNATEEGRAQNRRIDLRVTKK